MDQHPIGRVVHYFGKAMVAVVKLEQDLKIGATVKFVKGDNEFEMAISSMQIDHQPVESGKRGDEIAIKVSSPAKEGARVYEAG